MKDGKHVREPWGRKLLRRLATNHRFNCDQGKDVELAYTQTSPDTIKGAILPAPFRFEITCIILIAKDALVAWYMVCELLFVLSSPHMTYLARKRAMAVP